MKKHNAIKVVLITLVIFILLAWILPAAYFQTELVEQGRVSVGLFDLSNYFMTAISYFGYIALFIVVIGAFYGILYKIPAYRNMLDKIAENLKGNEKLYIIVTIMVFSILTSLCGVQLAFLIFFPFVTSIILLLGYDKMVVALTLVGSTMAGIMGTTTAYSNVNIIVQALQLDGIKASMLTKVAILIFAMVAVMITTLRYINRKAFVTGNSKAAKKTITTVKEEVKEDIARKVETKTTKKVSSGTKKTSNSSKKANSTKKKTGSKSSGNRTRKSSTSSRRNNKAFAVQKDVIVVKDNGENSGLIPTIVDSTHKIWPLFLTLFLVVLIVFLGFMPWADAFGLKFMTKANEWLLGLKLTNWTSLLIGIIILSAISLCTKNKVKNLIRNDIIYVVLSAVAFFAQYGFHLGKTGAFLSDKNTLFGKLFGTVNAFGSWTINEIMLLLFVAAIFLVLVYRVKFDDMVDGIIAGVKKSVVPAFIVLVIYTLLVLATYHPFQTEIYKFVLGWTKSFNMFTTSFVSILASVFNADMLYTGNSVLPYFTSIIQDTAVYPKVAVIVQSMYGLTMLIAPTSVVLMVALSYLNISFKDWFKAIWKLLVVLLIVLLFVFAIWKNWFSIVVLVLSIILFIIYLITMKD